MTTWRKIFHKSNEYAKTATEMKIDQHADPRVQLEQAIQLAQEQNETLRGQAAVVIGHQKQEEARLQRMYDAFDEAKAGAQAALQMAQSKPDRADEFNRAAQTYAGQAMTLQAQIQHEEEVVHKAAEAADEAKQAIQEHAEQLQDQLRQRSELVAELDQTEMEETLHSTMSALRDTANSAVPSLDQVRTKIETRKAKQDGLTEIEAASPDHALNEVRHAAINSKADAFLDSLRTDLPAAPQPQALEAPK